MAAEADAFASEFLRPADDVRSHLENLKPGRLAGLRPVRRVSTAALTRRARDLGCISDAQYTAIYKLLSQRFHLGPDGRHLVVVLQYTAIYKLLSQRGYRTREPDGLVHEEPTLYRELIEAHARDLGYSTEDFCGLFGVGKTKLYATHGIGRPPLRLASHASSAFFLSQRAWAAFRAISERCSGVSFAACALPPPRSPSRPNSTAAGFLPGSSVGSSPIACWNARNAVRAKSL